MKRLAVLAMLFAVPAYGQTVVQDGQSTRGVQQIQLGGGIVPADSTGRAFRMTADGFLRIEEANPLSSNFVQSAYIIGSPAGVSLAAGAADSSAVINVAEYRTLGLYFKLTPGTGAGRDNRIAVQIRAHLNGVSDSLSTFTWHPEPVSNLGVSASTNDTTLVYGHLITGSATVPWSGEFQIVADGVRNSPVNGVALVAYSYPNGIYVQLRTPYGGFWAPYMSVRVRNLVGPTCVASVHLVGTSL